MKSSFPRLYCNSLIYLCESLVSMKTTSLWILIALSENRQEKMALLKKTKVCFVFELSFICLFFPSSFLPSLFSFVLCMNVNLWLYVWRMSKHKARHLTCQMHAFHIWIHDLQAFIMHMRTIPMLMKLFILKPLAQPVFYYTREVAQPPLFVFLWDP